jgi:hypothetical protein
MTYLVRVLIGVLTLVLSLLSGVCAEEKLNPLEERFASLSCFKHPQKSKPSSDDVDLICFFKGMGKGDYAIDARKLTNQVSLLTQYFNDATADSSVRTASLLLICETTHIPSVESIDLLGGLSSASSTLRLASIRATVVLGRHDSKILGSLKRLAERDDVRMEAFAALISLQPNSVEELALILSGLVPESNGKSLLSPSLERSLLIRSMLPAVRRIPFSAYPLVVRLLADKRPVFRYIGHYLASDLGIFHRQFQYMPLIMIGVFDSNALVREYCLRQSLNLLISIATGRRAMDL